MKTPPPELDPQQRRALSELHRLFRRDRSPAPPVLVSRIKARLRERAAAASAADELLRAAVAGAGAVVITATHGGITWWALTALPLDGGLRLAWGLASLSLLAVWSYVLAGIGMHARLSPFESVSSVEGERQ